MDKQKSEYKAYLLRMWCVENEGIFSWRASLEPAGTAERLGFHSLDKLFTYLREQTEISGFEPRDEPETNIF